MIGQNNLLHEIDEQVATDTFPRFSILTGPRGSGKKHLAYHICKLLGITPYEVGLKIDDIRQMIKDAYRIADKQVYIISDADTMSMNAKNALLKICEEPCNNAYIIMTVNDIVNVLDTIKSRGSVYKMLPYKPSEILEYADKNYQKISEDERNIISEICETPGDVDLLYKYKPIEFTEYVNKVVDSIADVSGANAFKIANKIAFKEGTDGYDVELFLRAFKSICANEMKKSVAENDVEGQMWFSAGIRVVSNTLNQLKISGINRIALFDLFILDIRREWV